MPADQRRASIIAATRPLLAEHGLDLTTRQVAEATGIAEGTIFRHFTSKDELISAVIADSLDALAAHGAMLARMSGSGFAFLISEK